MSSEEKAPRRRRRSTTAATAPVAVAPLQSNPKPIATAQAVQGQGPRKRRSVARAVALVDPVDVPDDAEGRVEFIVNKIPDDIMPSETDESHLAAGVQRKLSRR